TIFKRQLSQPARRKGFHGNLGGQPVDVVDDEVLDPGGIENLVEIGSRSEVPTRIALLPRFPTPTGPVNRRTGTTRALEPERVRRPRARVHDHALRLQVELQRVETELAPEAGLLVAAERNTR